MRIAIATHRTRLVWLGALALLLLAIDQATKQMALHALGVEGATHNLPGPLALTLVFNHSNAFGLAPVAGGITRWGLVALNLTVAAALVVAIIRSPLRLMTAVGMAVLAAGAVGNALDRALLGHVVDFVDASKLGFRWVFNVADTAIDAGIGLLILSAFLSPVGPGAEPRKGVVSRIP